MKASEIRLGNYFKHNSEWCYRGDDVSIFQWSESDWYALGEGILYLDNIEPIPLTEDWLLSFGFEDWGEGKLYSYEQEKYKRFVIHNDLDGTSNFEVHYVKSNYGYSEYSEYIVSCDEDDRINWGDDIKNVNQLQNLYFALTGKELKRVEE